jgi:hypothetical protein
MDYLQGNWDVRNYEAVMQPGQRRSGGVWRAVSSKMRISIGLEACSVRYSVAKDGRADVGRIVRKSR